MLACKSEMICSLSPNILLSEPGIESRPPSSYFCALMLDHIAPPVSKFRNVKCVERKRLGPYFHNRAPGLNNI